MAEHSSSEVYVSRALVRGNVERVLQPLHRRKPLPERRPAAVKPFHVFQARCDEVKRILRQVFKSCRLCHAVRIDKFAMSALEGVVRLGEGCFAAFHTILHLEGNVRLADVLIANDRIKRRTGGFKTRTSGSLEKRYYCYRALSGSCALGLAAREAARG